MCVCVGGGGGGGGGGGLVSRCGMISYRVLAHMFGVCGWVGGWMWHSSIACLPASVCACETKGTFCTPSPPTIPGICHKFHIYCLQEGGVAKKTLFLGFWDEEKHKEWFSNAGKRKQSKT